MNSYPNSCVVRTPEGTCFDLLTEDEQKLVDDNMVEVFYKKGEIICKQGSFASKIIFLSEGLVKVYLEGQPKNLILTITPKNNLVGLPSIYEGNNTFSIFSQPICRFMGETDRYQYIQAIAQTKCCLCLEDH